MNREKRAEVERILRRMEAEGVVEQLPDGRWRRRRSLEVQHV